MRGKILIITTVSGFLWQFEQGNIRILRDMGIEIHYASNFDHPAYSFDDAFFRKNGIITHSIPICKSPYRLRENARALGMLLDLIRRESIDVIHCHTPVGAVLGRLAGRLARRKVRVIYTAHGFHFYKGAPWKNWILYYPAERLLARYTDCLVTINEEDRKSARRFRLKKGGQVHRIPGVGVNLERYGFRPWLREKARRRLGVRQGQLCILTAALLDRDKNYQTVLEALAQLTDLDFQYFICGEGPYRQALEAQIQRLGLQDKVHLLGFCRDMELLLQGADLFLFPSLREGLGMAALEAMACQKPVICADNRGTREYLRHMENGMVCSGEDHQSFARAIRKMACDPGLQRRLAKQGQKDVTEHFSHHRAEEIMRRIYREIFSHVLPSPVRSAAYRQSEGPSEGITNIS